MIAVALLAIGMGVRAWVERWPRIALEREVNAFIHELGEPLAKHGSDMPAAQSHLWLPPEDRLYQPPNPRQAVYHAAMKRKWLRAARYPWLPVEPDPPSPESE